MRLVTLVDVVVRGLAVIAAAGAAMAVFVVSIMANDAGTAAGARASQLIFGCGILVVGWVLLCSIRPTMVESWLPPWPTFRILLVRVPSYIFAAAVIAWCVVQIQVWYRLPGPPQVRADEPQYPALNPHPTRALEISGALPTGVPLSAFVAVYATEAPLNRSSGRSQCWRGENRGGQATWSVTALTKEELVPIEHDGVRYRSNVFIDRYLPGQCNWSLRRVDYRLRAEGADYDFEEGNIHVLDQKELDEWQRSQPPYQGRQDIWCGRATNRAVRPYTPVFCHRINQLFENVSEAVQASVPKEEIQPHGSVYATPETTSIEFNFHDFDHCVMHDYGRLLSLTAAPDCPRL